MNKIKGVFFIGLLILFILGIFSGELALSSQVNWPTEYRSKVTTRTYKADYDTVFSVVMDVTADNGYPIIVINRENGIILTDYQSAGSVLAGRGKIKLDYRLTRVDDASTRVRLNIHCTMYSSYRKNNRDIDRGDNLITEDDYRRIFDVIGRGIERKLKEQAKKSKPPKR